VVFDHALGKPLIRARTEDLSVDGAGIFTPYGDLTGSVVNLLLAYPERGGSGPGKVLKARARVVSTVRAPGMSQYRHGLKFIRSPGDGLALLGELLKRGAGSTVPGAPGKSAPPAQTQTSAEAATPPPGGFSAAVSGALERAYAYLSDLVARLNVEHPAYPRGYAIAGVPDFSGLAWEAGQVDCDVREISPSASAYERVSLRFRLSGKKQISVGREFPASEKLEQLLRDCAITFETHGVWSKRGSLAATRFVFPCQADASLLLVAQHDSARLLLRARNVAGFGMMEQILAPAAVSDKSLDELAGFILGETWRLGTLLDA
jgi:hypothetical protein